MKFMKNLFLTVLFLITSSLFVAAQPPASGTTVTGKSGESFVSLEGGFSIDLPKQVSSYAGITSVAGVNNGGSNFTWKTPNGAFTVGYDDRISRPEETTGKLLNDTADKLFAGLSSKGAELAYRKEITFKGNAGIEIKIDVPPATVQARAILVKQRLYIVMTVWPVSQDGLSNIKILDSFDLIDSKAIIANRLEEATPKPLPQTPAIKRKGSDANSEHLIGLVASVITSKEYFEGGSVKGIIRRTEDYFDKDGYYTKIVEYDYRGNPFGVSVYGFIDGKRVSKRGEYIDYEYNPPPAMAPPGSAPKVENRKQADGRYNSSYDFKYDDQNRLIEEISFNNRSEKNGRSTYSYEGNKVKRTYFNREDKPSSKSLHTYDDKFNLTEETYYSSSNSYPDDSLYFYTYLAFDEKGNWTKREVKGKTGRYRGGTNDFHYIEYRTITFYR